MLIDSHCHLHDPEFFTPDEAEAALARAKKNDVQKIICIGTSHKDSIKAHDFAASHNNIYWTYGIHPGETSASNTISENSKTINFESSRPVAIGEIGLDYHYDGYNRKAQIKLFEEMLQLAQDNSLPVSFHVREAFDDFFEVVANFPKVHGVVHSFSDNKKNLRRILNETDFYIGVNGLATYSTLPTPPLERILLETDAPFLAPTPFRGNKNEPAYIPEIAKWLSVKLDTDYQKITEETTKNTQNLFGI